MDDRITMLELATADETWMRVDNYEATAPTPSYSYRTVEYFVEKKPTAEWFWLMGCDQWLALPQWKHPEILARHLTFLVFSRGDIPQSREGYRMQHLNGDHPASATALRDPKNLHYIQPDWLHPAVISYIHAKELYR
jgi:nicotinate-nucleotide adenylyltransferase